MLLYTAFFLAFLPVSVPQIIPLKVYPFHLSRTQENRIKSSHFSIQRARLMLNSTLTPPFESKSEAFNRFFCSYDSGGRGIEYPRGEKEQQYTLVLYYTSYCPYCKKVLNYLKQTNRRLSMKDLATDPSAKEELKRIGGKMQVPCLVIDNQALYDSGEIIKWLSQHLDALETNV